MGWLNKLLGGDKVIPTHIDTLATFRDEVVNSEVPVIVDVWSPTCAPCRKLVPVLQEVATRHQGRVKVAELSTSAEPGLLAMLRVMATPTIIIYDQGEEMGRVTGFRPRSWFDEMIDTEFPAI